MDNETKTHLHFFPEAEQIEIRKESSNDAKPQGEGRKGKHR